MKWDKMQADLNDLLKKFWSLEAGTDEAVSKWFEKWEELTGVLETVADWGRETDTQQLTEEKKRLRGMNQKEIHDRLNNLLDKFLSWECSTDEAARKWFEEWEELTSELKTRAEK